MLDPVLGTNLMYSLHFYACDHTAALRARAESARSAGLPLFVTEWGAVTADGGQGVNGAVCETLAQEWHDWMDAHSVSWAAWSLCTLVESACIATPAAPVTGTWDKLLTGHGPFVRDRVQGRPNSCANPRLIDTLEDQDTQICSVAGRFGDWFLTNDGTGSQLPASPADIDVVLSPARGYSQIAARSHGSGFVDWGATLGVVLVSDEADPGKLYYFDASAHAGLRFHARGSGSVTVNVTTGRTQPAPNGRCSGLACFSHFAVPIVLGSGWVPYLVPFAWLESNELGAMTAQDQRELISIEFTAAAGSPFDIWVDDLGFY
jgi:hypothetical protein